MAGGITQHTVLLNLSRLKIAQIKEVEALIGCLQDDPQFGILDYTGLERLDENAETRAGFNRSMTHSFTMHFASSVHRDHYLPHPKHQAIGKTLKETYKLRIPEDVVPADTRAKLSSLELLDLHVKFFLQHEITIFATTGGLTAGAAYLASLAMKRDMNLALKTVLTMRRATTEDVIHARSLWLQACENEVKRRKPLAGAGLHLLRLCFNA